jgi:hypothetical protein
MLSGIYVTITDMMERREKRAGGQQLLIEKCSCYFVLHEYSWSRKNHT